MAKKPEKPAKPRPDWPLFPHDNGQWCKKIRGRLRYFGPWADAPAALGKYLDQRLDLEAGREPRQHAESLLVSELCNLFVAAKRKQLDAGELSVRTVDDYVRTCDRVVKALGPDLDVAQLRPADFARLRASIAARAGLVRLRKEITTVKTVMRWAYDSELIEHPVRYGQDFSKPSAAAIRKAKAAQPAKLVAAEDLRCILAAASPKMRTILLDAINCGYGNMDVARLPVAGLDLTDGWVSHPRPKTGVERRCPLWPETIAALRNHLERRAGPTVFVTRFGNSYADESKTFDQLGREFRRLQLRCGIAETRGFYCLRHTFATVADEARDPVAARYLMGHAPASGDMGSVYRETISSERLRTVVDHIRAWLFPPAPAQSRPDDLK